jgi:hypothetical protein
MTTARTVATFSWRETIAGLRHPGPLPRGLAALAAAMVTGAFASIAILVWLGRKHHGLNHYYFKEWQPGTYLSVLVLIAAGVLSATIAHGLGRTDPFARFWWIAAVGLVYLGLDDLLTIHESMDFEIHRLLARDPEHPVTRHLDDLIVAGYGPIAAALAYRYRVYLAPLRWTILIMVVAFVLFVGMVFYDLTDWSSATEESLKLLSDVFIFIALYAARLQLLHRHA